MAIQGLAWLRDRFSKLGRIASICRWATKALKRGAR